MSTRNAEWALALLSIAGAILALLAGAYFLPLDTRPAMLAASLMGLALWLVIGLYPDRD